MNTQQGQESAWRLKGVEAALKLAGWWEGEEERQRENLEWENRKRGYTGRKNPAFEGWSAACAALRACWVGASSLMVTWTAGPETDGKTAKLMNAFAYRYLLAQREHGMYQTICMPRGRVRRTPEGWQLPHVEALRGEEKPWVWDEAVTTQVGEALAKGEVAAKAPWLPEEMLGAQERFSEAMRRGPGLQVREDPQGVLIVEEWPPGWSGTGPTVCHVFPDGKVACPEETEEAEGREALWWGAFQGSAAEEEEALERLAGTFDRKCPVVLLASGRGYGGRKAYPEITRAERQGREKVRTRIGELARRLLGDGQCSAAGLAQVTRYREVRAILETRPNLARWWGARCHEETDEVVEELRDGKPLLEAMGGGEDAVEDLVQRVEEKDWVGVEHAMERVQALSRGPVVEERWKQLKPGRAGLIAEDPRGWCMRMRSDPKKLLRMEDALATSLGRDGDPERDPYTGWAVYQAYPPGAAERVLARALWRAVKGGREVPEGIEHLRDTLDMVGQDLCEARWSKGLPAGRRFHQEAAKRLEESGIRTWRTWRELSKATHDPRWIANRTRRLLDGDRRFLKELHDPRAPEVPIGALEAVQIRDAEVLSKEGARMEHCVGMRLARMVAGKSLLVHIGPEAPAGATMELDVPSTPSREFRQRELRAAGNEDPEAKERAIANVLVTKLNTWWRAKTTAERRIWICGREQRQDEVKAAQNKQGELDRVQRAHTLWPGLYDRIVPKGMSPVVVGRRAAE